MSKKIFIVLISAALLVGISACAAQPAAAQSESVISVTGQGKVHITPDTAYISVGVHSEAQVVAQALEENNRQAQTVSNALQELGIAEADIQTTAFNVFPVQKFSPMGEPIETKYAVDNTVLITVRDLSSLGQLLDAVVQAGANNIHSIIFDVQDKEAAYSEARKMAVENARTQAEELAEAANVTVGKVVSISSYVSGPLPAYEAKVFNGQGGSEVPVAAGQIVISIDASVSFAIE